MVDVWLEELWFEDDEKPKEFVDLNSRETGKTEEGGDLLGVVEDDF